MNDHEIRELALERGLSPQQANLVVAENQVFGTARALIVIKAFEQMNTVLIETKRIMERHGAK